ARSPLHVSLKCDPALAEQLRDAHAAVSAGYHLNKRHWNTVVLDGSMSDRLVQDMIEDSYDLVVSRLPKSRRRALGWSGEPDAGGSRLITLPFCPVSVVGIDSGLSFSLRTVLVVRTRLPLTRLVTFTRFVTVVVGHMLPKPVKAE